MKIDTLFRWRPVLGAFLLLPLLIFATACAPPASDTEVDQVVQKLLAAFQESDIDKITAFYGEDFYKNRSPEEWRKELQDLFKTYGKTQSIGMRNKQADTRYSAKFYIYQFDTLHDNHKRIKHTLTLIRPVTDTAKILVVGHMIQTQ